MGDNETSTEAVAGILLAGSGLSVVDTARLALEIREMVPRKYALSLPPLEICRRVIRLGIEAFMMESNTITFREAVELSLQSRAKRRLRTLAEIRQNLHRIMRIYPELSSMPVRRISSAYCREIIMGAFPSDSRRIKARRLLHAIFTFCLRHGWCAYNPVTAVDVPTPREKPISVLGIAQVRRLLATARQPEHLPCAPAVGFMLWAGIRPTEIARLHWEDVHADDKVISIDPRHSKTGGARHVTLYPVLSRWLQQTARFRLPHALIVPRAWDRRWRALRLAAGFQNWAPDTLRHTFASYHLKYFSNFATLQVDMGHADSQLLRTRYLSMKGITSAGAREFWGHAGEASAPGVVLPGEGKGEREPSK